MSKQFISTVDLVILGFLSEKPMSAYDLAQLIEEKHASKLVKISTPTVYKNCKRLFADGFLSGKTTQKTKQPEKTVYSLTKKGTERFAFLMAHFSSNIEPIFFNFNAFIYHLGKLNKRDGLKMLKNLHDELSKFKIWIAQHEKEESESLAFPNKAIVKQYRMIATTLYTWGDEVMRDYQKL